MFYFIISGVEEVDARLEFDYRTTMLTQIRLTTANIRYGPSSHLVLRVVYSASIL